MPFLTFLNRLWYYFRQGYTTYLTFILGALNTLTVVYYLLIRSAPDLQRLFPSFMLFAILGVSSGVPLAIFIGWIHMKRSPAYTSELDISVEANPYNYRFMPGINREVWGPMYEEMLIILKKLASRDGLLTAEDQTRISDVESKLRILNKGGYVGTPRRKWVHQKQ